MTPARRRSATPATEGPTRTAPDVPITADLAPVPARTKGRTRVLGPEGEPLAQEAPTGDAGGQEDRDDRVATPSPRRPLSLYPLPVWPD